MVTKSKHPDHMLWLVECFPAADERSKKLMTLSVQAIWYATNKLINDGLRKSVQDMVVFILGYLVEIEGLDSVNSSKIISAQSYQRSPGQGIIKINFDSTFNCQEKTSFSGVKARNKEGLIRGASTYSHLSVVNPFVAEALACEQAI